MSRASKIARRLDRLDRNPWKATMALFTNKERPQGKFVLPVSAIPADVRHKHPNYRPPQPEEDPNRLPMYPGEPNPQDDAT